MMYAFRSERRTFRGSYLIGAKSRRHPGVLFQSAAGIVVALGVALRVRALGHSERHPLRQQLVRWIECQRQVHVTADVVCGMRRDRRGPGALPERVVAAHHAPVVVLSGALTIPAHLPEIAKKKKQKLDVRNPHHLRYKSRQPTRILPRTPGP